MGRIEIDRLLWLKEAINIQVRGFADVSERACGTCVYLRSVGHREEVKSRCVHILGLHQ